MRRLAVTTALLLILLAAGGALTQIGYASAYEAATALSADSTAQQQARGEAELPWLFAVYIITWAAFFGYVFVMSRRQREMRAEIEALKRALAERD